MSPQFKSRLSSFGERIRLTAEGLRKRIKIKKEKTGARDVKQPKGKTSTLPAYLRERPHSSPTKKKGAHTKGKKPSGGGARKSAARTNGKTKNKKKSARTVRAQKIPIKERLKNLAEWVKRIPARLRENPEKPREWLAGVGKSLAKAAVSLGKALKKLPPVIWRFLRAAGLWLAALFIGLAAKIKERKKSEEPLKKRLVRKLREFHEYLRSPVHDADGTLQFSLLRVAALAGASYIITMVCLMITLQSVGDAFAWTLSHFGAFILTGFLILVVECGIFVLSGSLFAAGIIPGIAAPLLCFISYCKLKATGNPLLLSDFFMVGELGEIAGYTKINVSAVTAAALVILAALFAALFILSRKMRRRPGRFSSRVCCLFLAVTYLCTGVLPAEAGRIVQTVASQAERSSEMGVISSLYASAVTGAVEAPEDYSEDAMSGLAQGLGGDTAETPETPEVTEEPVEETVVPNVIFYMAESFFDVTTLPNVTYSQDPLSNYHSITQSCTSGTLYSSTYSGGTGYVELEVMTGVGSYYISETDTLPALPGDDTYSNLPSIPKIFLDSGYSTTFIHSYTNRLYNRSDNFPQLGFQKIMFKDDFTVDTPVSGQYVDDDALVNQIIQEFESNLGGGPQFIYGLSMETHVPYSNGLFGDYEPVTVESENLNEEQLGFLQSYITAIYDADQAIGKLVDYLSQQDEPVMLVLWGDHRPGLDCDGESIYQLLGAVESADTLEWSVDELKEMLSTNYFIWTNYETEEPEDGDTSSYFLGAQVIDRLGLTTTRWFNFLLSMNEEMLMCRDRMYIDADGNVSSAPEDEKIKSELSTYQSIIYDVIYGDGYLTDFINEKLDETG